MKKILALLACLPLLAFGQNYPSPTYKNLTANGTTNLVTLNASGTSGLSTLNVSGVSTFSNNVNQLTNLTATGIAGNCSGTIPSTNYCVNYWQLGPSTFDDAALSDPTAFVNGFAFLHNYGGSQMTGGRQTFYVQSTLAGASSASNGNRNYVAGVFYAQAASGDGGTSSSSSGTSKGAMFALNPVAVSYNGATNLLELTGAEFDIAAQTGSSMWYKAGLTVVETNNDAVQGTVYDTAIAISNGTTSTFWNNGILFGPMNGKWPFGSTSCIICTTGSGTASNGIDFSASTFTNFFLHGPSGFSVTGAGAVNLANVETLSYGNPTLILNDTSGSSAANIQFENNGTINWIFHSLSSTNALAVQRYVSGVSTDTPITIANATGIVTLGDGLAGSTSGSSPGCASGLVGSLCTATTSGTSLSTGTIVNGTSVALGAGNWDVQCSVTFLLSASNSTSNLAVSVGTTSVTLGGLGQNNILGLAFPTVATNEWLSTPVWNISLASSGTAFCPIQATFSAGTITANTFIRARRVN